MNDRRSPHEINEELANFTDSLLDGEKTARFDAPGADRELGRLQETVKAFARLAPGRDPDLVMKNRIRSKLVAEWKANGPRVRGAASGWRSSGQLRQIYATASVLVIAILVMVVVLVAPAFGEGSPGAAQIGGGAIAILLLGAGVIAFVIWRKQNKP